MPKSSMKKNGKQWALRLLLKRVPFLNVVYALCGGNLVIIGPITALLGAMYLALDREHILKALMLVIGGLVITLIGINSELNKRGRGMRLFSKEAKTPFEELTDVVIAVGKGIQLRNVLMDGVDIGDIDEAIGFIKVIPEAVAGIKNISFEELTDEQKAELHELVKVEWDIPDDEKIDRALPFIVTGLLNLGQGIDIIV